MGAILTLMIVILSNKQLRTSVLILVGVYFMNDMRHNVTAALREYGISTHVTFVTIILSKKQ